MSDPRAPDDPSLRELNQRLLEIKKGPNAELAKVTSEKELESRFKQLKNLSGEDESEMTDEKLHERFQKISLDGRIQQLHSQIGGGPGVGDDEERKVAEYLQHVQTEDGEDEDDFELFLVEAGISDKMINRLKDCSKSDQLNPSDTSIAATADGMANHLESALVNSDNFVNSFESIGGAHDKAHSEELSQLFDQAMDELRLLPTASTSGSVYPLTSPSDNLQEIFDSDLYENDEIRRLVSEAQDLAALERKYQQTTPGATSGGAGKGKPKDGSDSSRSGRSSQASLTHYDPNDYYYRTQARNIIAERDRRKKQKRERRQRGRQRSSSDTSDSSEDDEDSSSDESC
jgi:hypothetical protein